jgi:heme/copper-type cytochrome/quinol oxidase subunit 2
MVVAARKRSELVPVNLARRLLRTKRTLVLPAHVNLTVVTNSYDVVHSWFIPGLGIKLDCVPGRSTHHSFYIDNVGFYYGQCAEICGRYHHHMPIRICALPFEQFLVWWQHKGIKRLHRIQVLKNNQQIVNTQDIKFRYKW